MFGKSTGSLDNTYLGGLRGLPPDDLNTKKRKLLLPLEFELGRAGYHGLVSDSEVQLIRIHRPVCIL